MEIRINTVDDLQGAAREFVQHMPRANVLAFYGKMGAGKTTFIKAVCRELGVEDVITSPTFAIVNEYTADAEKCAAVGVDNPTVYHFDFYRLKHADEAYDIGFDDYMASGALCFIEWPEVIEPLLPDDVAAVRIEELDDGSRKVVC